MKYVRTIKHATSVKSISVIKEATSEQCGITDFGCRPVFSVFDIGTIEPPIPLDNSTVNLMIGFNFELLKQKGINSHYIALVDDDGKEISAKEAILRKLTPTKTRVKFVNRVMPEFTSNGWDYSMFANPTVNNYVLPIEFISRNELPPSCSVWKSVKKGVYTMKDLGLPDNFQPGDVIPENLKPVLDYSTKFEPEDKYVTKSQVQDILGITNKRFEQINNTTKKASNIMTDYAASRGFKRLDGKVEYITVQEDGIQKDILGDAVCTWHEDRLLTPQGIGISKQRIRNKIKELNPAWYEDIEKSKDRSKKEGLKDFRSVMDPNIKYISPDENFFKAINTLFRAGTNQWLDSKIYNIYPNKNESLLDNLARAVEDFQKVK